MADFFQDNPNFINPSYVTPDQRKAQIEYANALMKRAGEGITRPTGALAAMIDQLTANIYRNATMRQEQAGLGAQEAEREAGYSQVPGANQPMASALMRGPPQGIGTGNPTLGNPAFAGTNPDNAKIEALLASGKNADGSDSINLSSPNSKVLGFSPAESAPVAAGGPPTFNQRFAQAYPNSPGFDPGTMSRMMGSQFATPEDRAFVQGVTTPKQGADVYGKPTVESFIGGVQGQRVGGGVTPGINRNITVGPEGLSTSYPAPANGAARGIVPPTVLEGAMDAANRLRMNAASSGAVSDFKKADLTLANDAPLIRRVAGTMMNDLQTHGDQMFFGPHSAWATDAKRVAADLAPGFMKDHMAGLASADSFDKMSAQLTSLLAKGGGTDAQLFNNMKSVPGSHNSAEGAKALLDMTIQSADQAVKLADFTSRARTPEEYRSLKETFFRIPENQIHNPITGNTIRQDVEKQGKGGARILSVEPPR